MHPRMFTTLLLAGLLAACHTPTWRDGVAAELPVLGHRNWVVIADSAYPAQTGEGIVTAYAGGDQLEAVGSILAMIDAAPHVRAHVYLDNELGRVSEADAPGIGSYRTALARLVDGRPVEKRPHAEIIEMLDKAGESFEILIVKTDMVLPYTSVFIRLECGYWADAAEKRLREGMKR